MVMDDIKKMLFEQGAALVGYADLDVLLSDVRENLKFGISFAIALNPVIISGIIGGPTKEYYAEYKRVNKSLNKLGGITSKYLGNLGYRAIPLAATNVGIDPETHSTRLPHKTVATRAGLGWIGKCALLVTEEFGSAIRIASVLTDAELEVEEPVEDSRCDECMYCVEVCPGKAPSGKNWELGMHRDTFFNPSACSRTARELSGRVGIKSTICGMCIVACPWTKKYLRKSGLQCL
jgi:epoxyqueuosine reductase QueG